jgi:hypothetical protein
MAEIHILVVTVWLSVILITAVVTSKIIRSKQSCLLAAVVLFVAGLGIVFVFQVGITGLVCATALIGSGTQLLVVHGAMCSPGVCLNREAG